MFTLKSVSLLALASTAWAATLTVNPSTTYQTIDGFGGMNGWTTMPNADVKTAYSPSGLNFNIFRVRLSDNQNDWASIAAMTKYAYSVNPNIKVFASAWAPPANMLDKNNVPSSCHIKQVLATSSYAAYATYLNSFITYMKNNGAPLYAISMQNEPDWDWTCWTPEQMVSWLKQYGSQITGALMIAPEPLGMSSKYINAVLSDSTAAANVDIVGGHIYGSNPYSFDSKGKPIWMTEHLLNDNVGWAETMTMAREINSVFTSGWNAYLWWYIRRYYSFIGDGEQGTTSGAILPRVQPGGLHG
ncbi:Endo-1,4-beta-xylanase, putative, xyn5A [Rhizophlyctis rosea]|uniref:Endo-1,4-beta-xylanase, putative, xyn5A n=1 Tax=Rhizophlyctis rosea TaxID=64517 RepID=A0AAD5X0H7_9FUNG|nr:Endo-1,4-beta-xylanase, putative, xyn5A [Rhizophlyctis rosea]